MPIGTKIMKCASARKEIFAFASLVPLLLALGTIAKSEDQEAPRVKVHQAACGALLRDDFNSGVINKCFWRPWQNDAGVQIEIDSGELCVRGTSARVPDEILRKDESKLWRYVGVMSMPYPQVDLALAVRVKMPGGISGEPGLHAVSVHLCGVNPDTYPEVLYGKMGGEETRKIVHDYAPGAPCDTPYPDARGWFLAVVNQNLDNRYLVSGMPIPEVGDERKNFHDVLVDYDGATRLARGFLKDGERWIQLGKAEPLIRGITQVELKIIDATPLGGTYREARFDNCRLYPNPRNHPIRFVVVTGPYDMRYHGPKLRVALYTSDGVHKVSEGFTDDYGTVNLPVHTPLWVTFPVSAMFRIFRGNREIATSLIEAHEVEGLYPGDVWVFDTYQIH